MRSIVLVAALLMTGCATATLSERNYGPPKSGTARYLNNGASFVIEQRRKDADKKITAFCEGRYSLKGEGEEEDMGGAFEYTNMRFTCDAPDSPSQDLTHP